MSPWNFCTVCLLQCMWAGLTQTALCGAVMRIIYYVKKLAVPQLDWRRWIFGLLFCFKLSSSVFGISYDPTEVLHVLSCSSSTHSSYAPLFLWLFSSWALLLQAEGSKAIFPCCWKGQEGNVVHSLCAKPSLFVCKCKQQESSSFKANEEL